MANRQTMMRLIERNMKSVLRFGEHIATVANNPSENGTRPTSESLATEAKYSVGGRPAKDVLLNEGQAVYIASKSGTPLADEAHIGLVQVFLEWRHGGYSATVAKNSDGELDAKRACYAAFPEVHQDRAGKRAEAQAQTPRHRRRGRGNRPGGAQPVVLSAAGLQGAADGLADRDGPALEWCAGHVGREPPGGAGAVCEAGAVGRAVYGVLSPGRG